MVFPPAPPPPSPPVGKPPLSALEETYREEQQKQKQQPRLAAWTTWMQLAQGVQRGLLTPREAFHGLQAERLSHAFVRPLG